MSQLIAQQTASSNQNGNSISLQQVEGAQALIALQQQNSISGINHNIERMHGNSISTSMSNINSIDSGRGLITSNGVRLMSSQGSHGSKRAKYENQLVSQHNQLPPFSAANSVRTERSSNSPQLNIPSLNDKNHQNNQNTQNNQNSSQSQSQNNAEDFSAPTYIDKQQKSGEISSFIHKINKMIELAETDQQYWTTDKKYALIHWNEDGRHFIIHEPDVFTRKLIPTHFRHQKLPSFIRQLNQYGFKKLNRMEHDNFMKYKSEYFEYYHEFFNRDKPEDWHKVKRRRNEPMGHGGSSEGIQGGASQFSEKKISEAYMAGINAGRVEAANQQIQSTERVWNEWELFCENVLL